MNSAFTWLLDIPTPSRRPRAGELGRETRASVVDGAATALTRRVYSSDGGVHKSRKKVPFPVPIHRGPFTNMYTLPAIHPFLPNPLLSPPLLPAFRRANNVHDPRLDFPSHPTSEPSRSIPSPDSQFHSHLCTNPPCNAKPQSQTKSKHRKEGGKKKKKKHYPLFAFPVASRSLCVCRLVDV